MDRTWIAVTGNRNEFYQSMYQALFSLTLMFCSYLLDCASVRIEGSGKSTLDDLPDMFVGDMTLPGRIGPGECRSTARYAMEYPDPGEALTITRVRNIGFKKPTRGKCSSVASHGQGSESSSSIAPASTTSAEDTTTSTVECKTVRSYSLR